ncbi:MAG: efflux RND transporter permease subunit [Bacteroidota bacterium]
MKDGKGFSDYKVPVMVIMLLIIAGGIFVYQQIQTSLFPEITFPKIKIIADCGLQPADKMMITVTKPLENAIKQVPNLKTVRSITSRGSCEISAFFNWNSDINLCQQLMESRIAEIKNDLPDGTQLTVEQMNPSILLIMGFKLESNSKDSIALNLIANNIIKPYLSQVNGVSAVRILGGKNKEYYVTLDQNKMSSFSITPQMVQDAIGRANFISSNGFVSDYHRMYLALTDAVFDNKEDIENCVLRSDGNSIIKVKDIASVSVGVRPEYVKINADGKESLLIGIVKQPNANLLKVSEDLENKVTELKTILPKGVVIQPYYIQADFVKGAMRSVTDSLWIGLLLALFVVFLYLRSVKAGLTILFTIPVTLGLTLIVLYACGYTINIMTLGAIAASIGLIIDDAIVLVEQFHRTRELHPAEKSSWLVSASVKQLFPSMLGSSISTIVIFIPFFLMSGVAGAYFKVLTTTMIITLVCSFFVTWIGLRYFYLFLYRDKVKITESLPVVIQPKKWISYFSRNPVWSFIFIVLLMTSSVLIFSKLEKGFLPEMDEGSIVLDYVSPPGTSLEETDRMLKDVEKIIATIPEVESYSRRTGTQMGFFITEPNTGDYLIQLKTKRNRTTDEVTSELRQRIEETQPALRVDFGQVIGDMLGDLMASVQPVEIKIFGDDHEKLKEIAGHVAAVVEATTGTADVFDGITVVGPAVNVQPDQSKLALYQISPADFQNQVKLQLEGLECGSIPEKEQLTAIRLLYPGTFKMPISKLSEQKIFLPTGKLLPMSSVADIHIDEGDAEIERENLQTMVAVTGRLENRDLGGVMKDIQTGVRHEVNTPKGYHIDYGGAYAEQQQSFKELLLILFLASSLVFLLILILFKDLKASLLILFISVIGAGGSVLALFLTGTPLNVGSYTGLIMIVGIVGENAIFTFRQFTICRQEMDIKTAINTAVSLRLRPNLMTAFGAIIALMPLALGIGTGSQLHQPLATAVIGGFLAAIPLLTVVLPSLMVLFYWEEK